MKIGIMQPYFLPYLGYFQLMNLVDKYVVYDDVNFIKGGRINRNNMLNTNGKPLQFNILLNGASPNKLINEIELLPDMINRHKTLKSIFFNYQKAPYFSETYSLMEEIFLNKEKNLALFIFDSFNFVCKYLGIKTKLMLSSSLAKKNDLKAEEKVYDICRLLKATDYYNSIGGENLYSHEEFKKLGINLHFLKMDDIKYKQFDNEFVPFLSILDVMMFNSVKTIQEMLKKYTLI